MMPVPAPQIEAPNGHTLTREQLVALGKKVSPAARKEIDGLLIDLYAKLHSAKGSLDQVIDAFEDSQKVQRFLETNNDDACTYLKSGMNDLLTCFEMMREEDGE